MTIRTRVVDGRRQVQSLTGAWLDVVEGEALPPIGARMRLLQGDRPIVTVEHLVTMPNRTYVLVRFDDGDTLTVYCDELEPA